MERYGALHYLTLSYRGVHYVLSLATLFIASVNLAYITDTGVGKRHYL